MSLGRSPEALTGFSNSALELPSVIGQPRKTPGETPQHKCSATPKFSTSDSNGFTRYLVISFYAKLTQSLLLKMIKGKTHKVTESRIPSIPPCHTSERFREYILDQWISKQEPGIWASRQESGGEC